MPDGTPTPGRLPAPETGHPWSPRKPPRARAAAAQGSRRPPGAASRPLLLALAFALLLGTAGAGPGPWGATAGDVGNVAVLHATRIVPVDVPDALFPAQYAPQAIHAPEAWLVTKGSPTAVLALLDSGADLLHADLVENLWDGNAGHGFALAQPARPYDLAFRDAPYDDMGHGTMVAGGAVARIGNAHGISGVANVPLLVVKAFNRSAPPTDDRIAQALRVAVDHGARVVSISLGFFFEPTALRAALDHAAAHDVLVVASAGNDNGPASWPARYADVLSVAAVDNDLARWARSNHGKVDLAAPGVDVLTTAPNNAFLSVTGTSISAPAVAAVAALVRSVDPTLSAADVRALLVATADDLGAPGSDPQTGAGLVNASAAVRAAAGLPP